MQIKLEILFFRILKHSIVFKYFYKKVLTEFLFDLEIYDVDKDAITEKYKKRLSKI